jgi:hypothetical protein
MAWTQAETDQIRAAILALATGARVATVSYAGPPARSVDYSEVDLDKLRALLAEMTASAGGGPSYRLAATRKGL